MSKETDSVAAKADSLRTYMSNRPDALITYAKWYGKVQENISVADMTAIDTKGMTLLCTLERGGMKRIHIQFEPSLKGYEDVKPRLLEMKAIGQEGLGIIKAPQVTVFYFPWAALFTTCLGVIPTFCFYAPPNLSAPIADVVTFIQGIGGMTHLQQYVYLGLFLHTLECVYTTRLCWRHRTGISLGALYVISTFLCGFPIWINLRKRIRTLRVESVMKSE